MKRTWPIPLAVCATLLLNGCNSAPQKQLAVNGISAEIIALERAALDRWGKGDPQGYLSIYAPDITYFDPSTERRIDGFEAIKTYYAPFTGKIKVSRYDMIAPKVQQYGNDIAVLSFQLVSYGNKPDGSEQALARWNSTEVYRRTDAGWKIAHNHWSYIKPELKQPALE